MHVDRAFVHVDALPNGLEKLGARKDASGVRGEEMEKSEFLSRELYGHPVDARFKAGFVHDEGTAAHDVFVASLHAGLLLALVLGLSGAVQAADKKSTVAEISNLEDTETTRVQNELKFNLEKRTWEFTLNGKNKALADDTVRVNTSLGEVYIDEEGNIYLMSKDESEPPLCISTDAEGNIYLTRADVNDE